jgi:tetratricopeptide (TPR) repeat protein
MRKIPWPLLVWPGLPQLWREGAWGALLLALGAAWLLDVLLLSTLVWHEWLSPVVRFVGWTSLIVIWVAWVAVFVHWQRKRVALAAANDPEALFRRAQWEYLQGDAFKAEATLQYLLAREPRDAEARLLLATLLRHQKRLDEADDQLKQLSKFETAARWLIEITVERAKIKHLRKAKSSKTTDKLTSAAA